jgi:GNAT superfamily N-acetyltransferase
MTDTERWLKLAFDPLSTWLQAAPGFIAESGEGWWFAGSDLPIADHNCLVITAGGEVGQRALECGLKLLKTRHSPALVCLNAQYWSSEPVPGCLADLAPAGVLPHYMLNLDELIVDGGEHAARSERVVEKSDFGDVRRVLASALTAPYGDPDGFFREDLLDDPRLTFNLARIDGRGVCAAVTWRRGELLYLMVMGTDPDYQRRGIGRAVLESVLVDARNDGARYCHLVSSEAGARFYPKLGFQLIANHPLWLWEPEGS